MYCPKCGRGGVEYLYDIERYHCVWIECGEYFTHPLPRPIKKYDEFNKSIKGKYKYDFK